MKASPLFLGACAFASIAGAVGGATTNTTPIQNAGIGMDMLPDRQIAFDPSDSGLPDIAPPDHYAMITPHGRVEVAELSARGLYSQQRFGWQAASYAPQPDAALLDDPSSDRWAEAAAEPPTVDAQPLAAPVQPLDLSPPSGGSGQPRVINVSEVLNESQG